MELLRNCPASVSDVNEDSATEVNRVPVRPLGPGGPSLPGGPSQPFSPGYPGSPEKERGGQALALTKISRLFQVSEEH